VEKISRFRPTKLFVGRQRTMKVQRQYRSAELPHKIVEHRPVRLSRPEYACAGHKLTADEYVTPDRGETRLGCNVQPLSQLSAVCYFADGEAATFDAARRLAVGAVIKELSHSIWTQIFKLQCGVAEMDLRSQPPDPISRDDRHTKQVSK